jgi:hypothetical protein
LPPKVPRALGTFASNIEGAADRDIVIQVLRDHGVSVVQQEDQAEGMLLISKGEYFEARRFPVVCRKKLLRRLERKFGIPLSKFYGMIH